MSTDKRLRTALRGIHLDTARWEEIKEIFASTRNIHRQSLTAWVIRMLETGIHVNYPGAHTQRQDDEREEEP